MTPQVFAHLIAPSAFNDLPPPWRFVPDTKIARHFGVTTRTLSKWRDKPNTPRWVFDDDTRTFWYQPGVLLLWAHHFLCSEEEILENWFLANLNIRGLSLGGHVEAFERIARDLAPTYLRFPSAYSNFANNLVTPDSTST
jgi:hypothetical protein